MQESLNLKKGFRKCPACSALVPVQAAFCPSCGAAMPPMPEPEPVQAQEVKEESVCKDCGAKVDEADRFCPVCGTTLPQTEPAQTQEVKKESN